MVFALCGGDKRIARLATLLIEDGYGVRAWALEDAPLIDGVRRCGTAEECVNGAGCIVLPMPCAPQRGMLSTPLSPRRHCLGELFAASPPGAAAPLLPAPSPPPCRRARWSAPEA